MTRTTSNDSLFGTDPSGAANILDNAGFEIWQRGIVAQHQLRLIRLLHLVHRCILLKI
jgi:hypothetical protein